MTKQSAAVRRARKGANRKLAISMPAGLAQAVEREVKQRLAPTMSEFIARAVEEKLERDHLREMLDEVWRVQPMTPEERAWADQFFPA